VLASEPAAGRLAISLIRCSYDVVVLCTKTMLANYVVDSR
jgi:hypothetical protein